jgi:hypothetical protein
MVSRLHLSVFLGIAAALWAILLLIEGFTVTANWFRPYSAVVGAMVLLLLGFENWGWRWKHLHPWFVSQPNIQGTWKGELTSLWTDPATGRGRDPIEVYLVIKQTFSSIRVRLITKESQSDCLVARICDDSGATHSLVGTYLNTPKIAQREGSPIHHGGMVLRISNLGYGLLDGEYWTDRGTKGGMRFEQWSPSLIYDFKSASSARFKKKR